MSYRIFICCPDPVDCCKWLPWEPLESEAVLAEPLNNREAHTLARVIRSQYPGHLVAVRPSSDHTPPVHPSHANP